MPYITQEQRAKFSKIDWPFDREFGLDVANPGELNYLITYLCNDYLTSHGLSYQTINDIVGALEGAKLEFYRRIAAPYEAQKIENNGDVY